MWLKEILKQHGIEDDAVYQAVLSQQQEEKSGLEKSIKDLKAKGKLTDDEKAELENLRKAKADADLKEKKKKGEQDQIIEDLQTENEDLQTQVSDLTTYKTKYEENLEAQRAELLEQIPEAKREFVQSIIDWKEHDAQVAALTQFAEDYKEQTPSSNPDAPDGGGDPKDTTAYDQAKESGDRIAMLKNAPEA